MDHGKDVMWNGSSVETTRSVTDWAELFPELSEDDTVDMKREIENTLQQYQYDRNDESINNHDRQDDLVAEEPAWLNEEHTVDCNYLDGDNEIQTQDENLSSNSKSILKRQASGEEKELLVPPIGPPQPKKKKEFAKDFEFKATICLTKNTSAVCYSNKLMKVYANLMKEFPVELSWNVEAAGAMPLWVRVTAVFTEPPHKDRIVRRCAQHESIADQSLLALYPEYPGRGVLEASSDEKDAVYWPPSPPSLSREGSTRSSAEWTDSEWARRRPASVSLPAPYSGLVRHFRFACLNSCRSGINGRDTALVYELLDNEGNLYGKSRIMFRACQKTGRDMKTDEGRLLLKPNIPAPFAALPTPPTSDDELVKKQYVPVLLEAPNRQTARAIAEAARLTLEHSARYEHNQPLKADFKHCLQVAQTQVDLFTCTTD